MWIFILSTWLHLYLIAFAGKRSDNQEKLMPLFKNKDHQSQNEIVIKKKWEKHFWMVWNWSDSMCKQTAEWRSVNNPSNLVKLCLEKHYMKSWTVGLMLQILWELNPKKWRHSCYYDGSHNENIYLKKYQLDLLESIKCRICLDWFIKK